MDSLNEKTVERLSLYRQLLRREEHQAHDYFYSHELAELAHVSPVQVRRDLMYIGYTGSNRKGYETREVIAHLDELLDDPDGTRIAIAGLGNLGKALANFFTEQQGGCEVRALFDIDATRVGRKFSNIPCYHIDALAEIVRRERIRVGVITTATQSAAQVALKMVEAGITAIINFTQAPLNLPEHVFLDQINMTTSLEKAAFFAQHSPSSRTGLPAERTILLIDDDPDIHLTYRTMLEAVGYRVESAFTGEEGLARLDAMEPPDLIVLDIMMENPDSGFLFLNELKEKRYAIPVILNSSIAKATANLLDVNQLGIRAVLQKPVDPDELTRSINNLLGVTLS